MVDNNNGLKIISVEHLHQFLERLGLLLTKAKALTTIGTELDCSVYEDITLNEYWNVVLNLIEEAEEIKHSITNVIKNY